MRIQGRWVWVCLVVVFFSSVVDVMAQSAKSEKSAKSLFSHTEKDSKDKKAKNKLGLMSFEELVRFPIPKTYTHYLDTTSIDTPLLEALTQRPHKYQYQMLVFGGFWWCGDTREIVSKLNFHIDKTNFEKKNILFVGLDREKQGVKNLSRLFNVTRVPTVILLEKGKEVGRLVEYGESGNWEKELSELLKK